MTSPSTPTFADEFDQLCPHARCVMDLFAYLPQIYFYAKDRHHRYVGVNDPVLRDVFDLTNPSDLLGKTDADFQPPTLADAYHEEDRKVMDGGQPIENQVWLVPHIRGTPRWYKSTKTPLRDHTGEILGLAGVMYPITTPAEQSQSFRELSPVIQHIESNYTQNISMEAMAERVGLSKSHFNQRFRELLRMSPTRFVLSRRMEHARRLLTETDDTITNIAVAVGFYDQSHFTKKFRQFAGITPLAYRKRYRST